MSKIIPARITKTALGIILTPIRYSLLLLNLLILGGLILTLRTEGKWRWRMLWNRYKRLYG